MAERPTRPTVPTAPDRQQPSTFSERADAMVAFLQTLVDYMESAQSYTDQRAGDADAAVLAAGGFGTLDLSNFAGKAIGVNVGGNMLMGITFQDLDEISQDDAEAGTGQDDYVTGRRLKQGIEALAPNSQAWRAIVTKTADDDSNLVFSGSDFDADTYRHYQFVLGNVLPGTDGQRLQLYPSDDGGSSQTSKKAEGDSSWSSTPWNLTTTAGMSTDEPGACGIVRIFNFHEDKGAMAMADIAVVNNFGTPIRVAANASEAAAVLQRPSVDGPLNYIRFQFASGNIASGSITLMGLRR